MTMAYLFLLLFLAMMTTIYFLPYRKLRGKIFTKLFWNPSTSLHYIRYKNPSFVVELERSAGVWEVISPDHWRANRNKVLKLSVKLSEVDISDRITNGSLEPAYELGRYGELVLSYGRKQYTLSIGKKVDDADLIYMNKSTDKDTLMVNSSLLTYLPTTVDDFKDMMLFDALYSEVTSIDAMFNGTTFLMTKIDNGWILKGQMIFEHDAKPLIDTLLSLEALKFAPKGAKIPAKPDGFVIVKIRNQAVTRYFFTLEKDQDNFLMPISGAALIVPKSIMDTIFNFQ